MCSSIYLGIPAESSYRISPPKSSILHISSVEFLETLAKVCKGCSQSDSSPNFSLAEFISIEPIVIRGLQGIETLRLEEPSDYVVVSLND